MLPNRFIPGHGQSSAMRKSRLEGKPSMLPKPRRPGSTDRLSVEARRPSAAGHRSSSAEPRGTFGVGRLSREASATKIQLNARSKSQQGERFGQSSITPLRSSNYNARPTTTPVRTPSEERASRSWQTSLDRALAYVTIKDQRPLSNPGWQRAEYSRVQEALAARAGGAPDGGAALMRPLTIARFVDITAALLAALTRDAKLNNDNYVAKLPHLSKRLLYPGAVSKSWLKTVNTLHAFPHALALVAYLLDMVNHVEMPVEDELLYVDKGELARLRRDYLYKCWLRFQDPGHEMDDLNEEYLQNLKLLLGNDEEKIVELQQVIKKYEACLEDEVEAVARAQEAALWERRDALAAATRTARAARRNARADADAGAARGQDLAHEIQQLDADIERATAESQQLKREVEEQPLTVAERTRLLDEVDYAHRVQDSKRALAHQIDKMVMSKETELALWQKKTLDACVEYKQALIHLAAAQPDLGALAVDEKELMGAECAARLSSAVEALKAKAASLASRRSDIARLKSKQSRHRAQQQEEIRAKIAQVQSSIEREQQALEEESSSDATDASTCAAQLAQLTAELEALLKRQDEYTAIEKELDFWEKQDLKDATDASTSAAQLAQLTAELAALLKRRDEYTTIEKELDFWEQQDLKWKSKLSSMREYAAEQRSEMPRLLEVARGRRVKALTDAVIRWEAILDDTQH